MLQTQVAYWTLKENKRHNLATEKQNVNELKQTIAYNTAQVNYWRGQLAELSRHNKATEGLTARELAIKRSQANASLMQADAALQQALAALQNADTNAYNAETNRINAGTNAVVGLSQSAANYSNAALNKEKEKTQQKENKWYTLTKVVNPTVRTFTEAFKDVSVGTNSLVKTIKPTKSSKKKK